LSSTLTQPNKGPTKNKKAKKRSSCNIDIREEVIGSGLSDDDSELKERKGPYKKFCKKTSFQKIIDDGTNVDEDSSTVEAALVEFKLDRGLSQEIDGQQLNHSDLKKIIKAQQIEILRLQEILQKRDIECQVKPSLEMVEKANDEKEENQLESKNENCFVVRQNNQEEQNLKCNELEKKLTRLTEEYENEKQAMKGQLEQKNNEILLMKKEINKSKDKEKALENEINSLCNKLEFLDDCLQKARGSLRLFCRIRPLLPKEEESKSISITDMNTLWISTGKKNSRINGSSTEQKGYYFNHIFPKESTQTEVITKYGLFQ
jgi:chromosome segregation ATPase